MNRKVYPQDGWHYITADKISFTLTFHAEFFDSSRSGLNFNHQNKGRCDFQIDGEWIKVTIFKNGNGTWSATHYFHENGNEWVRDMVITATGDKLWRDTSVDGGNKNFVPARFRTDPSINLYNMINHDLPKELWNLRIDCLAVGIRKALNQRFTEALFTFQCASIQYIELAYDYPSPPGEELAESEFFEQCIAGHIKRRSSGFYTKSGQLLPSLKRLEEVEDEKVVSLRKLEGLLHDGSTSFWYQKFIPRPYHIERNGLSRAEWRLTKDVIKKYLGGNSFKSSSDLKQIFDKLKMLWHAVLLDAFNVPYPWDDDVKKARLENYITTYFTRGHKLLSKQILAGRPISNKDRRIVPDELRREYKRGCFEKKARKTSDYWFVTDMLMGAQPNPVNRN
jgi:hypothetical protein